MKSTGIRIACGVLLLTGSLGAQSKPPTDPVTGTWTGYMAGDNNQRQSITVVLNLAGQKVTGTITGPPSPGDITSGTFDAATGALKLEIVVQDESKTPAVFEGTVTQDSAAGNVSINDQRVGVFNLTRNAGGAPASAAPPGANDATMDALRRSFTEVSDYITKSADLVPADKYTYRPTESVRTFGQMIAHIADGYGYYCGNAAGRKVQWSDATEKGTTDKATLVQKLRQATDACNAAHSDTGLVPPLIGNIGHANLHYGNLITYIRMLGLVPPSS